MSVDDGTYSYDAANRLIWLRQGSESGPVLYNYSYDNNGNRTVKRNSGGTSMQNCEFNQKNQVARIRTSSDSQIHTFAFDPNGYRVTKGIEGNSSKTHSFLEGEHLDAVYDQDNHLTSRYLRGVVVDEIVNGYLYGDNDPYGANLTYHHDQINSVTALTDHTGAVAEQTSYSAFGELTNQTGTTGNILGYTGREHDDEANLIYYRARYYDPEIGRFISEDPLGFEAGINFYAYVSNNPVNFNDPTGHYAGIDDLIFTGGGALVGLAGQGAVDLFRGELSGWQDYVAAGIGGAAAGEALLYTGPVGAGAIGGATSNIVKQRLNISTDRQEGFDLGSLAFDTTIGGVTGFIPGLKVPGITQGRNSYNAIFKQMTTKFENGTISNVTTKTAAKMFVGRTTDTSFLPGALVATGAGFGYSAILDGNAVSADRNSAPAAGGFVLYPNKPNTNMMQAVYSK